MFFTLSSVEIGFKNHTNVNTDIKIPITIYTINSCYYFYSVKYIYRTFSYYLLYKML